MTIALLTSAVEVLRTGHADVFVSWVRTLIMLLLVVRQVLTLLENQSLTRNLERRVRERTAELQASRQRFEALVQHSSDIVTVVDRSGLVAYQSGSIERILGYQPQELQGCLIYDLMEPEETRDLVAALEQAAAEDMRIHTMLTTWRHATGRRCRVEVTVTNLLANPDVRGLLPDLGHRHPARRRHHAGQPHVLRRKRHPEHLPQHDAVQAFEGQYPGTVGTRGIVRVPGSVNFDASVSKSFRMPWEGHRVSMRGEAFNVFNHVNFNTPNLSLATPSTFGELTKTSDARVMQFALRYEF